MSKNITFNLISLHKNKPGFVDTSGRSQGGLSYNRCCSWPDDIGKRNLSVRHWEARLITGPPSTVYCFVFSSVFFFYFSHDKTDNP